MKKSKLVSAAGLVAMMTVTLVAFQNCGGKIASSASEGSSSAPQPQTPTDSSQASTPGIAVPTANAVVARIRNGLQNNVNPTTGNFARALAQVNTNLPKVTDVSKAAGYDSIELLVYGACSDLTTGGTPLMQSKYNVSPTASITSQQAALVAAGVQMLNQYTGGLASSSSASTGVTAALNNLVTSSVTDVGTAASPSKIAFMSVCIAANTAGTTLLGF